MGALIPFLSGADTDLPFARRALDRCQAERAGLKGEVAKLKAMRADLEPKLGVIDQAEHEVDALLNRDAQSLIDRMRAVLRRRLISSAVGLGLWTNGWPLRSIRRRLPGAPSWRSTSSSSALRWSMLSWPSASGS